MKLFRPSSLLYVVLLSGALAAMWWGFGFLQQHDAFKNNAPDAAKSSQNERGEKPLPPLAEPPSVSEEKALPSAARLMLMQQAEANAKTNLLEPAEKNPIARFWFTSDSEYYVEYRRAGMTTADRMAFFTTKGSRSALYGQNDSGTWELISGSDTLIDKPQRDLYEKDAKGNWVKIH